MSAEDNTEQIRKAAHSLDPMADMSVHIQDTEGRGYVMDTFRRFPDRTGTVLGRLTPLDGEVGEHTGDEVIMPAEFEVTKPHLFEYVRRHKGAFITIGSAVITIAAGAGILVRRHRKG